MPNFPETNMDALIDRQEHEVKEYEINAIEELKKCKKGKAKKEMEIFQLQQLDDIKTMHRDEQDELEEWLENGGAPDTTPEAEVEATVFTSKSIEESKKIKEEEESIATIAAAAAAEEAKIEKAKKKRLKKAAKLDEIEAIKAEIAAGAGPNLRQLEIDSILLQLKKVSSNNVDTPSASTATATATDTVHKKQLQLYEIESDGNCLYRALAHQLNLFHKRDTYTDQNFVGLRLLAAQFLRSHKDDFEVFLDLDVDIDNSGNSGNSVDKYESYCIDVERTNGPKGPIWGGQVELQALSQALNRTIEVYASDTPVLVLNPEAAMETASVNLTGDNSDIGDGQEKPLRVSYHQHYYALGAHYNSVIW
jgi:OTU domain-containing protein 6